MGDKWELWGRGFEIGSWDCVRGFESGWAGWDQDFQDENRGQRNIRGITCFHPV
jgi:hypothetical protein